MEPRYLWILDFAWDRMMCIKLSDEELKKRHGYNDFEEFIVNELEDKYKFRLNDCNWMVSYNYELEKHGFED